MLRPYSVNDVKLGKEIQNHLEEKTTNMIELRNDIVKIIDVSNLKCYIKNLFICFENKSQMNIFYIEFQVSCEPHERSTR